MADEPTLYHGEWKRPSQRKREWQEKWDALAPAERAVFDALPYSSIPDLEDARLVVAEARPEIYREAARYVYEHVGSCDSCGSATDELLLAKATELEQEADSD